MKTNLNVPIETSRDAINYINSLFTNGELYHFEDDAENVIWSNYIPTKEELKQLDLNRDKVFNVLPDPFEYMLKLI